MELRVKIVRFIAMSAWDLFVPDKVAIVVRNFYQCFLYVDPLEKLGLLNEARTLSDQDIEAIIDAMSAEWQPFLAGGALTKDQRSLVRELVLSLRAASQPNAVQDPSEALRRSLNKSVLSGGRQQIDRANLAAEQRIVGQSMMKAGLLGRTDGHGPRALPHDAPSVPGYELRCVLGVGGFGTVYLGSAIGSRELHAIKVGRLDDKSRFEREVGLLSKLEGPYVVKYYQHGELPGHFWIAMEYLGQLTLGDLIRTKLTPDAALVLAEQILKGLADLHDASVIHRDLTPNNVMVDPKFRLKLIDFGLAKVLPNAAASNSATKTIGLNGAPSYMAPEQILDKGKVTAASDLWSFGVVLYELLTGQPPFVSTNIMALAHEILSGQFRVDHPSIPAEVRPFLERCLKRNSAERWINARSALSDFSRMSAAAQKRIRYERYRVSWQAVLENRLLQRFAEVTKGQLPDDAVSRFVALAQREGIQQLDEDRLGTILPAIFSHRSQIESATQELQAKAHELARKATGLTVEEISRECLSIPRLAGTVQLRKDEMEEKIKSLLMDKPQNGEEKRTEDFRPHKAREADPAKVHNSEEKRKKEAIKQGTRKENLGRDKTLLVIGLIGAILGLGLGLASNIYRGGSTQDTALLIISIPTVGVPVLGWVLYYIFLLLKFIVCLLIRPKIFLLVIIIGALLWWTILIGQSYRF